MINRVVTFIFLASCRATAPTELYAPATVAEHIRSAAESITGGAPVDAITFGATTIYLIQEPSNALRCHEEVHREQSVRDGTRWLANYTIEHIRNGYAGNRYEVEARERCGQ